MPAEGEPAAPEEAKPAAPEEDADTRDARMALEAVEIALKFEAVMREKVAEINNLLGSSTDSDVTEAVQSIVVAHSFGLHGARPSKILTLVFREEGPIKAAAVQAAQAVWLRLNTGGFRAGASQAVGVARGMLKLVREASLAEATSLEKVMAEWQLQDALPASLVTILWEVIQGRHPEFTHSSDKHGSLALLNMAAAGDAQLLRCKMELVIQQLDQPATRSDLELARHACVSLQRCTAAGHMPPKAAVTVVKALERILVSEPAATQSDAWFAAAEQAIETIFAMSDSPEQLMTEILDRMGGRLEGTADGVDTVCAGALARLIFCVGHTAIKTLVHIDQCEKMLTKGPAGDGSAQRNAPPEAAAKGKGRKKAAPDQEADEGATNERAAAADAEFLNSLGERLLEPDALLGTWAPLVVAVCKNANGSFSQHQQLRSSAALTLCKLMCVSASFCDEQLQLLFTVMRDEPDDSIRANITIALGDLTVKHPNLLEPWSASLYSQLRDSNPRVRKNMLMVLTHLILNDMVRVKGQVSYLALCLLDEDERIVCLTKLFFTEFAKKGSKRAQEIYNLLPDIVSSLSINDKLSADGFREILGFLIAFIEVSDHTESLVDRLCPRFAQSDMVVHHRQVAFCLASLTHTEKSVRKLVEAYSTYGNKLGDEEVLEHFASLVQKSRSNKNASKSGAIKAPLDELERLLGASQQTEEQAAAAAAAAQAEALENGGEPLAAPPVAPPAAPLLKKASTKKPARSARGKSSRKHTPCIGRPPVPRVSYAAILPA